ncbi:hypothetical protein [Kiloniella sp.]|uniref:hypothetical protein n=1 Tax=Kiloniella sp. TaxID=1938587 RepID=UPI003B024D36
MTVAGYILTKFLIRNNRSLFKGIIFAVINFVVINAISVGAFLYGMFNEYFEIEEALLGIFYAAIITFIPIILGLVYDPNAKGDRITPLNADGTKKLNFEDIQKQRGKGR